MWLQSDQRSTNVLQCLRYPVPSSSYPSWLQKDSSKVNMVSFPIPHSAVLCYLLRSKKNIPSFPSWKAAFEDETNTAKYSILAWLLSWAALEQLEPLWNSSEKLSKIDVDFWLMLMHNIELFWISLAQLSNRARSQWSQCLWKTWKPNFPTAPSSSFLERSNPHPDHDCFCLHHGLGQNRKNHETSTVNVLEILERPGLTLFIHPSCAFQRSCRCHKVMATNGFSRVQLQRLF